MFIFDQLKKNDGPLRVLAIVVLGGLAVLLAGLWWVQIVSFRDYQAHLETQSFRTVRIPAVRGKILDRNGIVLAENQASYNLSLYLDELRDPMDDLYAQLVARLRKQRSQEMAERAKQLGRGLTRAEKKDFTVRSKERFALKAKARYEIASNIVAGVSARLGQPLVLNRNKFEQHYASRLALPFPVLPDLSASQIAQVQEQATNRTGLDIDVQSVRVYAHETLCGHLLGALRRDESSVKGEEAFFSYRLPDYRGMLGIEAGYDSVLRGKAGAKSVLVNNMGYRQTETVWSPAEPGHNVQLTIDAAIQKTAEQALAVMGADTRGAAVVMEVHTGDILALASLPSINPNYFVRGFSTKERERLGDQRLRPQINRATQENYAPGSIFKIITGLAVLESGVDPHWVYTLQPDPVRPGRGCVYVGRRKIDDLAPAGQYNFRRALLKSSNGYFVEQGLHAGIDRIVEFAGQFHLGQRTGLPTRQETSGIFPSLERVHGGWTDGDTANICIGQGAMSVTPLQMTVMTAAIANGGNVLWPRVVQRIESGDPTSSEPASVTEPGRLRTRLEVRPENLAIIRDAMLGDVEDPEGTGKNAALPGMRISGKTGTAQVTNPHGELVDHTTWFVSFAPYESPKYAVVVMVEGGASGGGTCAPIARQIYQALQERERTDAISHASVAMTRQEPPEN